MSESAQLNSIYKSSIFRHHNAEMLDMKSLGFHSMSEVSAGTHTLLSLFSTILLMHKISTQVVFITIC